MASVAPRCQLLTRGLFAARESVRAITIRAQSRNCSSKKCNCDCPQGESFIKDPRDTGEECETYKKLMAKKHVENTCRINEWPCSRYDTTVCDPMECKVEKIEDRPPIPDEVFEQTPPCIPYEGEGMRFRNMCEIAQLRRCYAENLMKAHHCTSERPACFSWDKTYPMRHAGAKPEIDGRPIVGESWKKKTWGIKC
ncbi:uncharacterized protein LOC123314439 isoform X2 [Coccinella septempunctata]|uniref:uncharacterized protein LOC123314439 isoform X2 n=1 Tax=Coccinella septempunctata TaxID=41139 RepID=UPI001D05E947|nr:uncharacterized protein LOC123314439 isoform X2 [Coccinella septempunctata]